MSKRKRKMNRKRSPVFTKSNEDDKDTGESPMLHIRKLIGIEDTVGSGITQALTDLIRRGYTEGEEQ